MHNPDTSATASEADIPSGYTVIDRGGPYFHRLGPAYFKSAEDGSLIIALRVSELHANTLGVAHGGMLMTLADSAMGINVSRVRKQGGTGQASVTTTMSSEFLSAARMGEWLEAHTRIRRNGQRMTFVDCILKVGTREVLHASGTFLPI